MFDGVHAKKEGNCNTEVTKPLITWLTNLIYSITLLYLCIESALAFQKKEVLGTLGAQAC